jgi:hypothetical protein
MVKATKTNERSVVATLHREHANALIAYLNCIVEVAVVAVLETAA